MALIIVLMITSMVFFLGNDIRVGTKKIYVLKKTALQFLH